MTRNDRAVGVAAGLVACLALVAIVGLALPAGAQDGGGATEIDQCRNITEPGSYELTADITDSDAGTCIDIDSSDVSLDGQGHAVDGVDSNGTVGIAIDRDPRSGQTDLSNVDVTDVAVTDWGTGVELYEAGDVTLADSVIGSNGRFGVIDSFSDGVDIVGNEITGNDGSGVYLPDTDSLTVRNNTVDDNGFAGIRVFRADGEIANNTASGNADGIFLEESDVSVTDNTANDNADAGIRIDGYTGDIPISGNVVEGNARGVELGAVENLSIEDTVARDDSEWAYYSSGRSDFPPTEPNAVSNLTTGSATVSFEELGVALSGVASPPTDPAGRTNVGAYVNATSTREDRESRNGTFLALDVSYTDAAVASSNLDENSLRLFRFDDGAWSPVAGPNGVDTDANEVRANVTEFGGPTILAPLGYAPPADVTDDGKAPGDPDTDGLYEDVNGDGTFDVSDVQTAFANRRSIERRDDGPAFEFNGDGTFDVVDAQALFVEERAADAGTS